MDDLQAKIDAFCKRFNDDEFTSAFDLAKALETLTFEAWEVVNAEVPPSIRIDP